MVSDTNFFWKRVPGTNFSMLRHHLVLAGRNLRRAPIASAAAVLTLAVGFVCFLTAFAFAAFFERAEQGFANAERAYVVTSTFTFFGGSYTRDESLRTPTFLAELLTTDFPEVEAAARAAPLTFGFLPSVAYGDRAVRAAAVGADAAFLEIFDLPFTAGDRRALDAPRSAVLTETLAARLFGGEDPIGRSLLLENRIELTVTGVIAAVPEPSHMGRSPAAPLAFDLLASFDVYEALQGAPLVMVGGPGGAAGGAEPPRQWASESVMTYLLLPADGRLSAETLEASLDAFLARHAAAEVIESSGLHYGVIPVPDLLKKSIDTELFSGDIGVSVSNVLMALGVLVLGVACVNYANLATARAVYRVRDAGLRKTLGAQPLQIIEQHLIDAGLLSAAALIVALAVVRLVLPVLERLSGLELAAAFPGGFELAVLFAAVFAVVTLAAGAYPALVLSRVGAAASVRPSEARIGPKRLAALLVGAQFAVASLLLIGVTITWLQNARLERVGLGSEDSRLLLIENRPQTSGVDAETLRAELLRLPQVEAVSAIGGMPWQRLVALTRLSESQDPAATPRAVLVRTVGYDFFETVGIELLAGRTYSPERGDDARPAAPSSNGEAAPSNIVVDRAFAEQFFASPADAVGRLVYYPPDMSGGAARIIGVVETRRLTYRGAGADATVYPLSPGADVTVVRLAEGDISSALASIDALWRRLSPNVAISRSFMDETFNRAYETFRRVNQAFGVLALMAFGIGVAGLFGMAAFVAARRRPEIGVRKTFGASTRQIVSMLVASFSRPVVIAAVLSWPIAYIAARAYLGTFIDPIALTPAPFVGSLAFTLLIAWLAVGGQTLRAARTSPAKVLRQE